MVEMESKERLTIERRGDMFHLVLHNFGSYPRGHAIASLLGLEEIEAPLGDEDPAEVLEIGEYYMRDPICPKPNLHALIGADLLPAVSEAAARFEIPVADGAALLSTTPAPGTPTTAELRRRRKRGINPLWLVPAAVVIIAAIGAAIVVPRHTGDHRETVTVAQVFERAENPPPPPSTLGRLLNPSYWYQVHFEIDDVIFALDNECVTRDGSIFAIEGIDGISARLTRAEQDTVPLLIDALIQDGKVNIEKIAAGSESFAEQGEIKRSGFFDVATDVPPRVENEDTPGYLLVSPMPYDKRQVIEPLIGKPISMTGRIEQEEPGEGEEWDPRRLFRFTDENGEETGFVLVPLAENSPLEPLLALITGTGMDVQLDMVLDRMFPWNNRQNPAESRKDTRLIGEATARSATIQDLTIVDRSLDEPPPGEGDGDPDDETENASVAASASAG